LLTPTETDRSLQLSAPLQTLGARDIAQCRRDEWRVAVLDRSVYVRRHVGLRGQMLGSVPMSSFSLRNLLSHDNIYWRRKIAD